MNKALLEDRCVLEISGADARNFLQNLITNDMDQVTKSKGIYAFLLSPQGKYLHDFFVMQVDDSFLLITTTSQLESLSKRLRMLKLRADVTFKTRDDLAVMASWPIQNTAGNFTVTDLSITDGRATDLARYNIGEKSDTNSSAKEFREFLISKGIATPDKDFITDKTTMMEAGLDGQFAVSWTKGCFVGQELTARVKYRGLVKRLLVPTAENLPPETSLLQEGKVVGSMQSDRFALIKRDAIKFAENALSTADGQQVTLIKPDWWDRSEATQDKA